MRAGLIAAPLPLLWRHADAAAALTRVAARALIGCQRIGDTVHGDLAMHIAMETFTIRFLCGFGENLPDGVVPIDDIFSSGDEPPAIERPGDAADHVALVTFDITPEGIVPVARSHAELLAGGPCGHARSRHRAGRRIARRARARLVRLHRDDDRAVAVERRDLGVASAVRAGCLCRASMRRNAAPSRCCRARWRCALPKRGCSDGNTTVLAVWRAPERMAASAELVRQADRRCGVRRDRACRCCGAARAENRRRFRSGGTLPRRTCMS